jgi:hypothetical protein
MRSSPARLPRRPLPAPCRTQRAPAVLTVAPSGAPRRAAQLQLTKKHLCIVQTYEGGGDLQFYCEAYK